MVVCFICGSLQNSTSGGVNKLLGLQSKSCGSMKNVLKNLLGDDSSISASESDYVCLPCEVLCKELDDIEYERRMMRKILRRLIHSTYQINNFDRNWCQLDHKALGDFKINGNCYHCRKCDFKTKRFAHITPHHTFHQIQERRGINDGRTKAGPSQCKITPKPSRSQEEVVLYPGNVVLPSSMTKSQESEIFEFNIDCHEGDCLYSLENISLKGIDKDNEDFDYDLHYSDDSDSKHKQNDNAPVVFSKETPKKKLRTVEEYDSNSSSDENNCKCTKYTQKCRRMDYLYSLHCGCSHCENNPVKLNTENSDETQSTSNQKATSCICPICNQSFVNKTTYELHERWCQIKSALQYHCKNHDSESRKTKPKPLCSKRLENNRTASSTSDDERLDRETVDDIVENEFHGNAFDKKFKLFLRKTEQRLNTVDMKYFPI